MAQKKAAKPVINATLVDITGMSFAERKRWVSSLYRQKKGVASVEFAANLFYRGHRAGLRALDAPVFDLSREHTVEDVAYNLSPKAYVFDLTPFDREVRRMEGNILAELDGSRVWIRDAEEGRPTMVYSDGSSLALGLFVGRTISLIDAFGQILRNRRNCKRASYQGLHHLAAGVQQIDKDFLVNSRLWCDYLHLFTQDHYVHNIRVHYIDRDQTKLRVGIGCQDLSLPAAIRLGEDILKKIENYRRRCARRGIPVVDGEVE